MSNTQPFAIYSRKSRFTGKGESIENQIEMCRQYLRITYGDTAADSALVFEDEGYSGGNLERPQFKKMISSAKESAFQSIIVYRLDRISRNIADFAQLIEQLNQLNVGFISIKEQFDTTSPMGRAMMYISSVFSQLERETIAERIRDNMHELAKTGRWLGGTTPTGYSSEAVQSVSIDGKTKKVCQLKIVPKEATLVKLIFEKFIETNSLTKTETFLLQHSYVTKNNKQFTRFAIKGILTNPVYMVADDDAYQYLTSNNVDLFSTQESFDSKHGVMAYNRTDQKPGRTNQIKPMDEWIVAIGRHEGLIDGAAWVKAQRLLEQNRSKSYHKPRSNVALLSGILRCGNCSDYMRPKLTKRTNAKGQLIYSYLCSTKERSRCHLCNIKTCNGNTLDAAVIEQLKLLREDDSTFNQYLEKSKKVISDNHSNYEAEIAALEASIHEHEAEIQNLVLALSKASGTSAEQYIMQQIDVLHETNQSTKQRLDELKERTINHVLSDIEFNLLAQMLRSFSSMVGEISVEQKRAAIRSLVKEVVWDGQDAHIVLFGSERNYQFEYIDNREPLRENGK